MSRPADTPLVVSIKHTPGYATAACECGWFGVANSTRTIEGIGVARQEARSHAEAHTRGAGFFHYRHGWVPCDPHPAVTA